MIPMTLAQIADVVGGVVEPASAAEVVVDAPAAVDSRAVTPGGLFVALVGEHADGHAYAAAAGDAGAVAVLGSRGTALPTVVVDDPTVALGLLARHVRDRLPSLTVLALTVSQGKTGTKDLLAAVLAEAGPTVATEGNQNNELGVPLTVLRADPDTRFLVVEMGARGIGHIAYLCTLAPPDVAAVLNVGTAHLGEFGSREAIAQAKGELVEALTPDGTAVLNADDPLVAAMATRTHAAVATFGEIDLDAVSTPTLGWHGVRLDELGRPSAALQWHDHAQRETTGARVQLTGVGAHQVANAAAAAAMALSAGLEPSAVLGALERATSRSRWRMELHERADGLLVINDAYNANPASMRAALDALAALGAARGRRTVAVLGEMRELGDGADAEHRALGAYAVSVGVGVLITVGPEGDPIAEGAEAGGRDLLVLRSGSRDEALEVVRKNVAADDVVLVKASRGAALEHVADGLLADPTPEEAR